MRTIACLRLILSDLSIKTIWKITRIYVLKWNTTQRRSDTEIKCTLIKKKKVTVDID